MLVVSGSLPSTALGTFTRRLQSIGVRTAGFPENGGLSALQAALARKSEAFACVVHPGDFYGSHYVEDLLHAATYSGARLFGRHTHYVVDREGRPVIRNRGLEFQRVSGAPSGSMMARADLLDGALLKKLLFERWFETTGDQIVSLSRFGYASIDTSSGQQVNPDGAVLDA
jgi:hypothetical protein